MVSLKRFREFLVLVCAENSISYGEFVLLYDTFTSKNPDFPYNKYERFNLNPINVAECKEEVLVEMQDLPRLVQALQLPPLFKWEQRSICDHACC